MSPLEFMHAAPCRAGAQAETAPDPVSWRVGTECEAARSGGAQAVTGDRPGKTSGCERAKRLSPVSAAQLGAATQARFRSRPCALPELRRRIYDHRGDSREAGDREDPRLSGPAGEATASGACARPNAAASCFLSQPTIAARSDRRQQRASRYRKNLLRRLGIGPDLTPRAKGAANRDRLVGKLNSCACPDPRTRDQTERLSGENRV